MTSRSRYLSLLLVLVAATIVRPAFAQPCQSWTASGTTDVAYTCGSVSIGTTSASGSRLHVVGDARITGTYPLIYLMPTTWSGGSYIQVGVNETFATSGDYFGFHVPPGKQFLFDSALVLKGNLHLKAPAGASTYSIFERATAGPDMALLFRTTGDAGWLFGLSGNSNSEKLFLGRSSAGTWNYSMAFDTNGYVGVGTPNPKRLFHVRHETESSASNVPPPAWVGLLVERSADTAAAGLAIQGGNKTTHGVGRLFLGNADEYDSVMLQGGEGKFTVSVRNQGAAPAVALTVNSDGNLKVTGNIEAKYQDVAEWVPAGGQLEPGTVVVLNRAKNNEVTESSAAYDTAVAGVVSTMPGVLLGESGPDKAMIATTGRVRMRVDASRRAIAVGDLLVTSGRPGMAMASEAVDVGGVKIHRPGTLIGKALEPLAEGEGEILVLLSLQ